jgi:hypothetical protein
MGLVLVLVLVSFATGLPDGYCGGYIAATRG